MRSLTYLAEDIQMKRYFSTARYGLLSKLAGWVDVHWCVSLIGNIPLLPCGLACPRAMNRPGL